MNTISEELRNQLNSKSNSTHRTLKVQYSRAFNKIITSECALLIKKYNVAKLSDLIGDKIEETNRISKLKKLKISVVKNLLGLIPTFGGVLTGVFTAADVAGYYLKRSDIENLKEQLSLKQKPSKKYRKIKNVLVILDTSLLGTEESVFLKFIMELINQKFLVNTLLLICEPEDFPYDSLISTQSTYRLILDEEKLKLFDLPPSQETIKMLNVVGIEYIDLLRQADSLKLNTGVIERIISQLLEKSKCTNREEIDSFLKLCSLLFENFDLQDTEHISYLSKLDNEHIIKLALDSTILIRSQPVSFIEFKYLNEFIRDYYQHNASIVSSDIKHKIFKYLQKKYPTRYSDMALISELASSDKSEVLFFYIKAYYYEKESISQFKLKRIVDYLTNDNEFNIGAVIIQLDNAYKQLDYSDKRTSTVCRLLLDTLEGKEIWAESKLAVLSYVAKIGYEIFTQAELKRVDEMYRGLLTEIGVFSKYKEDRYLYLLDYIAFSTSIENSYVTKDVVQKLTTVLYKHRGSIPKLKYLKFLRLGNAIYTSDILKGLEMTKMSYDLSYDYYTEHLYATVNYSCSLCLCGNYKEAQIVLTNNFDYKPTSDAENNSTFLSAENNYIIATYYLKKNKKTWLIKKFNSLYSQMGTENFSDSFIVQNNLLGSYILVDNEKHYEDIIKIAKEIVAFSQDSYHIFFAYQNLATHYFLCADKTNFLDVTKKVDVPELLYSFKDFFRDKTAYMLENFDKCWTIDKLETQLIEWGEIYPEDKFLHYKNPILFGLIERWFE